MQESEMLNASCWM